MRNSPGNGMGWAREGGEEEMVQAPEQGTPTAHERMRSVGNKEIKAPQGGLPEPFGVEI